MTEHRWEAQALLENGVTEGRVDGSALQLVTVCLSDDGVGEISDEHGRPVAPAPPVVSHLRPSEARALEADGLASAPGRVRVLAPVLAGAAGAQRRVDRSAVRAGRARDRAGV